MTRPSDAVRLAQVSLTSARLNLHDHANDCPRWDYESSNECETCERLERRVVDARQRLRKLREGVKA